MSDFFPHGEVLAKYGVLNEERGMAQRSVFIIDPEGVVKQMHIYQGRSAGSGGHLGRVGATAGRLDSRALWRPERGGAAAPPLYFVNPRGAGGGSSAMPVP